MKRKKGFTLIELLVVIAIIGLLLSIIMPALKRARDFGMRVVCSNTLKSFGTANEIYTQQYNGAYVPLTYKRGGSDIHWMRNEGYRSILDFESLRGSHETSSYDFPDKLLCPADKISKDLQNISSQNVLTSYAMNTTEWGGFDYIINPTFNGYMGHKVSTMKLPAERLVFIDAIDWWTHWHSADPGRGWNQYGQMSIEDYKDINLHGPVIYRHSEGANAAFYDGHVKYYPKGALFNKKDYEVKPRKPGMWVMDLKMYYARNP